MFFHICSYKNSCLSELAWNSIVFILILWSEASKTCSQKYFFGFLILVLKWWLAWYTPSMSSYWLAKHLNINYIVLQRCNLPFFVLKTFKFFLKYYQFCRKSGNDANSRGRGVMFFVSLWRNAYENWYVIYP